MDSFHKKNLFYFMLAYKSPSPKPLKKKKTFPKTPKEFLSSLVKLPLGIHSEEPSVEGKN